MSSNRRGTNSSLMMMATSKAPVGVYVKIGMVMVVVVICTLRNLRSSLRMLDDVPPSILVATRPLIVYTPKLLSAADRRIFQTSVQEVAVFLEDNESSLLEVVEVATQAEQADFVRKHCPRVTTPKNDDIVSTSMLFPVCVLALNQTDVLYWNPPPDMQVSPTALQHLIFANPRKNMVVTTTTADLENHRVLLDLSFLLWKKEATSSMLARRVIDGLEIDNRASMRTPKDIPKMLFATIQAEFKHDLKRLLVSWNVLHHRCKNDVWNPESETKRRICDISGTFSHQYATLAQTEPPIMRYRLSTPRQVNHRSPLDMDSTIRATITWRQATNHQKSTSTAPRNALQVLQQDHDCHVTGKCVGCLASDDKDKGNCARCMEQCGCYCDTLCHLAVPPKLVTKEVVVVPPTEKRDAPRLIPRIIHQTWFEDLDPTKYPNFHRFRESFQNQPGWEHRFYTEEDCRIFIGRYFPPEVLEAYDALLAGAFRADLFRYCVLLVCGGLYADIDILREGDLEAAVPPDVGFMIPRDLCHGAGACSCLWNGLMASSPGHPFLVRAIERVVHQVRNRFTVVDIAHAYCSVDGTSPDLNMIYRAAPLFPAGPCLLGSVVGHAVETTFFQVGVLQHPNSTTIPGRTVILQHDETAQPLGPSLFRDMSSSASKPILLGSVSFPGSNDVETFGIPKEHYSTGMTKKRRNTVYGEELVYRDSIIANEKIQWTIQRP